MGTRIGYVVCSMDDPQGKRPLMTLVSDEKKEDAEGIFRALCRNAAGATRFLNNLSYRNVKQVGQTYYPIFHLSNDFSDVQKVVRVHWIFSGPTGHEAIFAEQQIQE